MDFDGSPGEGCQLSTSNYLHQAAVNSSVRSTVYVQLAPFLRYAPEYDQSLYVQESLFKLPGDGLFVRVSIFPIAYGVLIVLCPAAPVVWVH